MKICPFISHMIGEDGAGVMEIPNPDEEKSFSSTHLFCLKESCRFYRPQERECSFDVAFDRIEEQRRAGAEAASRGEALDAMKSLLDRVWNFQTQSVAEMVGTLGESDQKLEQTIERIAELEKGIVTKLEDASDGVAEDEFERIHDDLARLHDVAQSREESMEALSSTISELVMNIEDRLKELAKSSEALSERIENLEATVPKGGDDAEADTLAQRLDSLVEAHSRLDGALRGWQQRIDSKVDEIRETQGKCNKSIEDLSAELKERREAEHGDDNASGERKKRARKLNNLGVTSFHNGEFELARKQFEDAVALDDRFAECYNNLGLVLTELGEEKLATDAFSTAIETNPELNAAYNNLGYVYYKQGRYDQAIKMYNEALERNASDSSAYTNLGNAYYRQDRFDEARAAWESALELDPSNRKASRSLKELQREMA